MLYAAETNNTTDYKCLVDVKQRRYHACSVSGCISPIKANSFCSEHLQRYIKTKSTNKIIRSKKCSIIRKSSGIYSLPSISNHNSNKTIEIFSNCQHKSKQNPNNDDDDAKSQSSIEYDYNNPRSIEHRHVSIATIYLQDEQWHKLELFIKHFSSYASLSNNLNVNSSTTHLLIDDSLNPFQCTFSKKIFQAVARHIFIVSINWIDECLAQNRIIDETSFEIRGDSTMSTMHLTRHLSNTPIFSSTTSFLIDCISFQRVLTRNDLAELVRLTGALLIYSKDDLLKHLQLKYLFILVDPTSNRCQLENKYKSWHKTIKYLTPGFLLKSIIYHKQQPFEDFELEN